MAMTPEGRVKQRVKELLDEFGAHYFMPVQTGFGQTHLDFICCYNGLYIAIETKALGASPTVKQWDTIHRIYKSSGTVFVICGVDDTAKLRLFLMANKDINRVPNYDTARQPYTQVLDSAVPSGGGGPVPSRKNNPI